MKPKIRPENGQSISNRAKKHNRGIVFQSPVVLLTLFPTMAVAANTTKDEKTFVPYGIIQSKYYLSDSTRDTGPETLIDLARFGLWAKHGRVLANLEANLIDSETALGTASNTDPGKTLIRAAWIGMKLPSDTFVQIGRVRPLGPQTHGTDLPSTLQQYRSVDGVRAIQTISLPEDGKIEFSLGVFNALRSATRNDSTASDSFTTERWNKTEKAWLGSVTANYKRITTHMMFGFERNAIVKSKHTTNQGNSGTTATTVVDANGFEIATISHGEGSLGYEQDHSGLSIFFEQDVVGAAKTASLDKGKLTTAAAVAGSVETTTTVSGLGANLNSKQFGITNMMQDGDAFTAGVAYTLKTVRADGVSDADQKGADVNEITASVSYTVGGLDLALGAINESSASKSADFAKADGVAKHARTRTYINAAWEF